MQKSSKRIAAAWPFVLLAVAVLALLIRLTIHDSLPYFSTVYYATPYPIIVLLSLSSIIRLHRTKYRRASLVVLFGGVSCLLLWLATNFYWHRPVPSETRIRVLLWNCFKGRLGFEGVAKKIRTFDADVIALVESGADDDASRKVWADEFPGYAASDIQHGCILLVRGEILAQDSRRLSGKAHYRIFDLRVKEAEFHLVHADIKSNPLLSRRAAINRLLEILRVESNRPTIALGDFNTPHESALLASIRENYSNAFESAGRGMYLTWPMPCPVLALDQIWISREWLPLDAGIGVSFRSDHRPIWTDLRIRK